MANSTTQPMAIIRVAIPVPLNRLFDYLAPNSSNEIAIGTRVLVPFGQMKKTGVVIQCLSETDIQPDRLKPILDVLDKKPLLSSKDIELLTWASQYYHYPLGEVMSHAFPARLRIGKPAQLPQKKYYALSEKGKLIRSEQLKKTPKQKHIFESIQAQINGIDSSQLLAIHKNSHAAIKSLIEKDLIITEYRAKSQITQPTENDFLPNQEQSDAIQQICKQLNQFAVFLLQGITGSGKTEVYIQVIKQVLELGQQVLVLLPEITLTPQLEQRFKRRFAVSLAVSHSKLNDSQRLEAWLEMQQNQSKILLGTRSALFTPMQNLGLIIIDEEHDASFKQQEGFRFSARDLAVVRAKQMNIPIILGSATPALESLYNVKKKRYQLLQLTQRAGVSSLPKHILLDIRNQLLQDGLSNSLIKQIKKTLAKKEQVLLFLNRRGYAPVQICHSCGWVAQCNHCDTNLVIHYSDNALRCHHCGHQQRLPSNCPSCQSKELKPLGVGTEKVEHTLHELFPKHRIIRLDRDSTQKKGVLETQLEQINQGQVDIILGTQMLAKGHHFPNVTLVAILDVDSGLFSIDYHATERLAQLIIQVAGRAGRAEKTGTVILQTHQPDHPLLNTLISNGYNAFANSALHERQQALLPPFSFQALLRTYGKTPDDAQAFLQAVISKVDANRQYDTLILGPVSAPMTKRANYFQYQLLFQNHHRHQLQAFIDELTPKIYAIKTSKSLKWSLDIDPIDMY